MLKTGKKQLTFIFLSLVTGIILSLGIAEATLRLLGIGYGSSPLIPDPVLHHVHPRDYLFMSYSPIGSFGSHPIYYDRDGLVSDPSQQDFQGNSESFKPVYKAAFLGDSFVEANHVAWGESFVGRLEEGARSITLVKNYGVNSYSPIYYLLQWREVVQNFHPTHLFVILYTNDVTTDEQMKSIAKFSDTGELLAIPGPAGNRLTQILRRSYLARYARKVQIGIQWMIKNRKKPKAAVGPYVEENPDIGEWSSNLVTTLSREVGDQNGMLILMAVPSHYRLLNPDQEFSEPQHADKWKNWAIDHRIKYIDLVKPFEEAHRHGKKLFLDRNIHFNETGHSLVASIIAKHCPDVFSDLP